MVRDPDHNDQQFAASIGVTRSVLKNWKRHGILFYTADKIAISLGHHPSYIWGDDYWYDQKTNQNLIEST